VLFVPLVLELELINLEGIMVNINGKICTWDFASGFFVSPYQHAMQIYSLF
jgi:hypothetical protein